MVTDDALVSDFEAAAKQSWQSFSTMKRFVCEANRLENASWRLWFMQKDQNNRIRKSKSTGSLAAIDAHAQQSQQSPPPQPPHGLSGKKASYDSRASSTSTLDADDVSLPVCVYCEMHAAHLSCNGCCHDVYCVSCFKLVHKKGTLATHTAVKIKELLLRRSMEQMMEAASEAESAMSVSSESQPDVEPSEAPLSGSKSPTHPSGGAAPVRTSNSNKTKPWEIQMDMLIQRLMMNSMHTDGDISVHNIDSRDSLGTAESVASFLSDIVMDEDDAPAPLKTVSTAAPTDWSDANAKSNQAVVAAAVLVAGRHQKRTLSFDGMLSQQASEPAASAATYSATSPSPELRTKAVPERGVSDLPLFPVPPSLPRTKSKKKNSVCQNCSGNHITIDCPLLASSGMGDSAAAGITSGSSSAMGVDTVLRKCFTTIHNDNLSNSTHAFLGDEISVRGGGHFTKSQFTSSANATAGLRDGSTWSSFGMNSISEDHSAESEDTLPVLLPLHVSLATESDARKWDCTTWLISSLATELPQGAYEAVRTTEKTCTDPLAHMHAETQRHALASWVFVKEPGRKWCKRYLSLYRNSLWEFLDDKDASRPVGYANVSEGSVHEHQGTTLEFALKYYRQSSPLSARNECWLQFESDAEAAKWREQLAIATRLQVDDLFDLAPDSGKNDSPESYELGKGRFSVVRRACRKRSSASASSASAPALNCALKIIDKNVFWDLVAHETEREDTVVREILTQSLLTVRSGALYCPVIRLLSLFETRNLLVLELELMQEGDLHEEIVTNSAIDEVRAPFLVASLVKAIDYCLQNGVAHRDVKLSNLALDFVTCPKGKRYSVIKMADFGMAAFIQSDGRLKGRCGTPGFVAPEILTAGKGESYPSGVDMFSVGVVTYTMLCGYEPFFGVNDDELIQMNKSVEYEFEEPEWATISDEAKDLITLMMEKDTTKRITPQEALAHPFLRDASAQLDEILRAEAPLCEIRLL